MEQPKISIITPSYNRASTLGILYKSLLSQTSKNFEWVIVDDGSEDNTEEMVKGFIEEGKIPIRYFCQENGGMHRAVNRCVRESKGEWIFKIDSDDYIFPHTIQWLEEKIKPEESDHSVAVVSGCRCDTKGNSWVKGFNTYQLTTNFYELKYHKKITGEFAECFRKSILRAYPWPEIQGEKYCEFSYVMFRMSRDGYKFKYYNEFIMISEYLPDGLKLKGYIKNIQNPVATTLCCRERILCPIPFKDKKKLAKKYWYYYNYKTIEKKPWLGLRWVWLFPPQYWRYLKLNGKLRRLKPIIIFRDRLVESFNKVFNK